MAPADDDDGFARRFDPSDDLLHIVIPDDLRELDAEVTAYRRELEAARKHERRQRRIRRFTPGWGRDGLPSPVFTVVLLLIATTGLLLSVFAPVTGRDSRAQLATVPLARPVAAAPAVGALLPNATLQAEGGVVDVHDLRPSVVVLLPAKCDCAQLVSQIVGQANESPPTIAVALVSSGTDESAFRLADSRNAGAALPIPLRDPAGTLARTYHPSATLPTLLLVRGDGTLAAPPIVFGEGTRLEGDLIQLRS